MSWQYLAPFLLACIAISVAPGSGAVASMNSGIRYGLKGAFATVAGLQIGYVAYLIPVWVGLGSVLASSPKLFLAIKWVGIIYLAYFGIHQYRSKQSPLEGNESKLPGKAKSLKKRIVHGFLVNFSNPKAALFMMAVVPQFLEPERRLLPQFLVMVPAMVIIDIVVMAGYASLGSSAFKFLSGRNMTLLLNKVFGLFFLLMALMLFLSDV